MLLPSLSILKHSQVGRILIEVFEWNCISLLIHKLIDSGADINTKNITNWTPLMFASANKFDDTNIIEYLVSKGGICDMKTTIQMAKSIGNTNISDYFEKIEKNTL